MRETVTLFTCAIIVSLDSFVAGFTLSINKKNNLALPAAVAAITLVLCLITTFLGNILKHVLSEYADIFGAAILLILAVFALFRKEETRQSLDTVSVSESVAIGFAVGTDAAVANLSLAMQGYGIIAPLIFAVTHFFTVFLGQLLAKRITLSHTNILSATVLTVLAVIKFI